MNTYKKSLGMIICCIMISGCEDFVNVELTKSKVTAEQVFSDDNTAESAVIGIYHDMVQSVFTGGSRNSLSRLAGLSADELSDFNVTDGIIQFQRNELTADNKNVMGLWQGVYKTIYQANVAMEGLSKSTSLSPGVKNQLLGEASFLRAFSYFYLINLFGDIPLATNSDYRQNIAIARAPVAVVYESIITDLLLSQELLTDSYKNNERVRPNKSSATALLARVYLYLGEWDMAEAQSTAVIENSHYTVLSNLNSVFLKNSAEAIWQLPPVGVNNTNEAQFYVITPTSAKYLVLQKALKDAFETGDKRLSNWVGTVTVSNEVVYFPHKYKLYSSTSPVAEYLSILRIAEQYLIRAEARARRDDLSNAIADLDVIRSRAGLPLIKNINPQIAQADLLLAIEQERRVEFFTEWGHRWFDLKRTGRVEEVLSSKAGFTPEDQLYPIPKNEIDRNPKLGNQNPGY